MAKFDVADAALAGFGVIRRKPLAVLVWGLVIYVLAIVPAIGIIGALFNFVHQMSEIARSGVEPSPHDILRAESQLFFQNPLATIGSLLVRVLLAAAICRAVVTPKDDRFFYLRLGRGELMLALVIIVAAVLLTLAIMVYAGVAVALGFLAYKISQGVMIAWCIIAAIGYIVGLIWVLLRFSLIAPASVIEKEFRLFESWRLTKGHAGSLFLVGLLNLVVVFLVQSLLSALLFGVGGVALISTNAMGSLTEANIEAFFSQPPGVVTQQLLPWFLGLGLIVAMVASVMITVAMAPWAHVYKALTEPVEG
ncbi:hypothetical protein QO010_001597 [Caulobacter ginsengisoli]|uniref:Glycerophosphoryl diester phosphodiesterase membrane domain-containing protein n=1 Tax=Caulobacter ginsengisoli TaxID=400775 RepID=A0ABU0IP89_9CAUL|nr:hypothetical protein [Caulobacter ginsengisoli]MDQ0463826.1 hypothetical protein [Caulobacter ginsengisoli]